MNRDFIHSASHKKKCKAVLLATVLLLMSTTTMAQVVINGNVFGGGNLAPVKGHVTVNIKAGTVVNDVYGGGALANTNTEANTITKDANNQDVYPTTVNLTGGTVGNAYGGGLGQKEGVNGATSNVEALVYGDVLVNVNGTAFNITTEKDDQNKDVVKTGRVFGCNNLNGTPKKTVTVHVYRTVPVGGGEHQTGVYEIGAVYGGGNEAAYKPDDALLDYSVEANKAKVEAAHTNVIIDGCSLTSIKQVYGGGNAASTPATQVNINGSFEIDEVFGGGNGNDKIKRTNGASTTWNVNPGANVGFDAYDTESADYDTPEKRLTKKYGFGKALVNINGGNIHAVYGGSNAKGNVRQVAVAMLEKTSEEDCFTVDEAYGGGKAAPMDGRAELQLGCIPGVGTVYGGARAAAVNNDVVLTVTNGTFNRVFGGNNESGVINGTITVNIEETGCTPIVIGQLFGGGNQASYTAPLKANSTTEMKNGPTLNIKSCTSIGEIYGGGFGSTAIVTGDTYININEIVGAKASAYTANTITINSGKPDAYTVSIPAHTVGEIGAIGNVYGGGYGANVTGNTYVNIGTQSTVAYVSGNDYSNQNVVGANITGDVFGGGFGASTNVTGTATINIGEVQTTTDPQTNAVTVTGYKDNGATFVAGKGIYGGSALGSVANTQVNLYAGEIAADIFGGGQGRLAQAAVTDPQTQTVTTPAVAAQSATISNKATVTLYNASVTGAIYGGCNINGTATATEVNMLGGTLGVSSTPKADILFAGGKGQNTTTTDATMNIGKVTTGTNQTTTYSGTATIYSNVYGGSALGAVGVTSANAVNGSATVNLYQATSVTGDVFGDGMGYVDATDNTKNVQAKMGNSTVNLYDLELTTNIYGGCNYNGTVYGKATVNLIGGSVADVYGGGQGKLTAVANTGSVEVNVGTDTSTGATTITGDIYGGSAFGGVHSPVVNIYSATSIGTANAGGNVFGGGKGRLASGNITAISASVSGNTTVNMKGGTVPKAIFGGCNLNGTSVDTEINVTGGAVGSTTKANNVLYGVFGGGYGQNTSVTGDVTVNIGKTTTTGTGQNATTTISGDAIVYGDVYGGSAQGSVNKDEDATTKTTSTTVHLYAGTVNGDVYGGGLGVKTGTTNIPAQVYGDVLVDLNNYSGTCAVTGGIFGCNNANGSPEGHVTVHVYKTNKATGSNASYDLAAVYGGGNKADYEPNDGKKSTEVVIEGCDKTSIQNVYGGGNAAATPATEVWILGTKAIENVFGGGNGTVSAANVGFKTGGAAYSNGTGKAETKLVAGNVTNVFGGSNNNGDVRGGTWVTMPQKTEYSGYSATTTSCCDNLVAAHIYGGGQNAPLTGGTNIVLGCQPNSWIEEIYAGSMEADVDGDVSLTITSGKFERVFGGNKNGGLLKGAIKVNIEETGGCDTPIIIGELYGGGNQADYSVYGYYQDAQDGNKWKGRTKAQYDTWFASLTDAEKANPENKIKDDPQLNVRAFTSIGAIYGGGYSAKLYGNPHVDINVVKGSHYDDPTIANGTTDKLLLPYPGHTKDAIGAIGNVFGGGNLATVYGNATVNIGTESTVTFITEPSHLNKGTSLETSGVDYIERADGLYEAKTEGANITNNVYGGGNQANVTGDTQVNICAKKSGTTYTSVTPGSAGVTIAGDVFGAGKGVNTDPTAALVESNSFIVMGNGSVKKSVYGGGELSQVAGNTNITVMNGTIGTPKEGTTVYGGATYGNVYGGGFGATTNKLFGLIKGNTNVTISGGTILHNVYGGGAYGSVGEFTYDDGTTTNTGMPTGYTSGGTANVTITGGTIGTTGKENGMIFGSSRGDVDKPSTTDNIDPNDRLAWVYDTHVTIGTQNATTGPKINGSLYGSGENGHTWNNTNVTLHSGTVGVTAASDETNITEGGNTYQGAEYPNRGNVYGGGCGTDMYDTDNDNEGDTYNPLAGIVKGNTTITIDGGTVAHNVYGAGAMGSVGTITKDNNDVVTITSGGTTTIEISGGTIGVDGTAGEGNVYGAARGDKAVTDKDLALVKETSVTISGTTTATQIKGNVYGGGEVGNVHTNTRVNIQGGAIAKNVFGGGKGVEDLFSCEQAMVGVEGDGAGQEPGSDANKDKGTIVTISNGTVGTLNSGNLVEGTGNVYGGGEIGRVEWNTQVKIGVGTGNGSFAPIIYGNVFGAGKGLETHGYSALVRGNSTVTVQGSAKVLKNVYGGGEKSTVGRYWVKGINNIDSNGDPVAGAPTAPTDLPDGMPYQQQSGGICSVTVQGSAQIGPDAGATDDAGHVFGAGKGVNPHFNASTSKKMTNNNNQLVAFTATTNKTAEELYLEFLETLALVTNSNVTINGSATIKGSIYGGSESGFVQHDTKVEIKNGTVNGDAFGGGLGLVSFAEAGKVKGNTDLAVSGGAVKGNVYGGGSLGDVGIIDKTDKKDGQLTYNYKWKQSDGHTANVAENNKITGTNNNTGICKVTVSGGTIGANGTSTANHASGHVFGAGKGSETTWWCEKATAYATNVIIKNSGTTVYGNVYGGGQVGRVEDDAKVTIGTQNGEDAPDIKGDVYGAGAGLHTHGYSALVRGNALVTVQGAALVEGSVYGGGEIASVGKFTVVDGLPKHPDSGGICTVNIQDKAKIGASGTGHNVFGACKGVNPADITDANRKSMQLYTNLPSDNNLWSRYNNDENSPFIWRTYESDAAYLDFLETLALTSHPIVTIAEDATVNGSVFGGGERGITLGSVEVNMNGGTVAQDVYGGGSLANSNKGNWDTATNTWAEGKTSATYTTTVNLTGGRINGDAYGGGLGQLGDDPIEAKVYGDVNVTLGDANKTNATAFNISYYTGNVVKSGRVFGSNNLNGSPMGDVTVTVWKTVSRNNDGSLKDKPEKNKNTYEVAAVYGGGNLADYTPTTGKKTNVNIMTCDVSVREVYGGGNAAAVPETDVLVNGAYEIETVFGGGNGKDPYTLDGGNSWKANKGANIGKSTIGDNTYGSGNTKTLLKGGYIHEAYGGSNEKGTIKGTVKINAGTGGDCTLDCQKIVAAGKNANLEGDAILIMDCVDGAKVEQVIGGADNANVDGNVELTITSGTFGKVFGGNNLGGIIKGHIKLNIEETGCTPIKIDELYLGGNQAAYSIYGYYNAGTNDAPDYKTRTSENDEHEAVANPANDATHKFPYADPELNIISCTYIGKVFGGGYGEGAAMYANPTVNINMLPGEHANEIDRNGDNTADGKDYYLGTLGDVFGGGNQAVVYGNTTVNIGTAEKVTLKSRKDATSGEYVPSVENVQGARIVGNVFGGGNEANIEGNTEVNIGTVAYTSENYEGITIDCVANTTENSDNETNTGMVFGGGNKADVTGNTVVNMAGGHVVNRIYGGGNLGSIGTFTKNTAGKPDTWTSGGKCTVTISGGKLGKDNMKMPDDFGYVFGASRGEVRDTTMAEYADLRFKTYVKETEVIIKGDAFILGGVYGGSENGHVRGDTWVKIQENCQIGAGFNTTTNLSLARYDNDSYINPATTPVTADNALATCAAFPYDVATTGKPYDPYHGTAGYDSKGGATAAEANDGHTFYGNVFGGGSGFFPYAAGKWLRSAGLVEGNTRVDIEGGHILSNVYGGNEQTDVYGTCTINMSGGTIGVPRTKEQIQGHPVIGNLFGAGKGDKRVLFNTWTNVGNTSVNVTGGIVYGSVFGGGEDGHVLGNATTLIEQANEKTITIGSTGESTADGNVFGGGRGSETALTAGVVGGNVNLTINSGNILGSVYGGGRLAAVGTFFANPDAANYGKLQTPEADHGNITININGGFIGTSNSTGVSGNVFGGSKGTAEKFDLGIVRSTTINMTGGTAYASVYGGGELAQVVGSHGNQKLGTEINISGGSIGINELGKGGATWGNVYGGGKGSLDDEEAGLVKTNTKINVSQAEGKTTSIYHNIYGGGAYGSVGTFTFTTGVPTDWTEGTGKAEVIINGGTIGINGKENGMVFGSSRGDVAKPVAPSEGADPVDPNDKLAWVHDTHVVVGSNGSPNIKGTIYGSGENGHVFTNTLIDIHNGTIGVAEGESIGEYSGAAYPYRGNVYGGGCGTDMFDSDNDGKDDAYNPLAGIVLGNATINIAGGHVVRNVYGAGAMGSVGTVNANGTISGGVTTISISGDAIIGASGTVGDGNVFGAARGDANATSNEFALVRKETSVSVTGGTVKGNVYGGGELGCVGVYDISDDYRTFTWKNTDGTDNTAANNDNKNTGICNVTVNGGSAVINGHVFGAGKGKDDTFWCEKGIAYSTDVSITNGTVNGNVYGGGEVGRVETDTKVKIGDGDGTEGGASAPTINGSVFGGGAGAETHGYSALVRGNTTVNVEGNAKVGHSVYGGGEIASVGKYGLDEHKMPSILQGGGYCYVTVKGHATITDDVFGAGEGVTPHFDKDNADETKRSRRMTLKSNWESLVGDQRFEWDYFKSESDYSTYLETLALATHPEVAIDGSATVNGSVFGGGELGLTKGSVVVNIKGGTIAEDVYGGGMLANTNTTSLVDLDGDGQTETVHPTTTVNLLGGTISRDVYGGGLGDSDTPAYVYGDVNVNLNGLEPADYKPAIHSSLVHDLTSSDGYYLAKDGCQVARYVFGCNNINGTPKGHSKVHVFKTVNSEKDPKVDMEGRTTYDLKAVFGGGNAADYVPADTDTKQSTEVIIDGCNLTSIEDVYGGGYGAATPGTNVLIKGTYIINNVFGGGYGAGDNNPGANVGYKSFPLDNPPATDVEKKTYEYGSGKVVVELLAGKVRNVYGGSNTKGDICKGASVNANTVESGDETDTNPCDVLKVDKIYGGGKDAPMEGGAEIVLDCMPKDWVGEIYAGAENADVENDVSLTITSGKFGAVYGGNKSGGELHGSITVNIEECDVCPTPIVIGELYGGGNLAPYSIYGYYEDGTDEKGNPILKPRTKEMYDAMSKADKEAEGIAEGPHRDPIINIRSFTSIGNVYGGGLGEEAVLIGNPTVNINEAYVKRDYGSDYNGETRNGVEIPANKKDNIGIIGHVYGGGNKAKVIGNTTVNVGTEVGEYVRVNSIIPGKTGVKNYFVRTGGSGEAADPYVYKSALEVATAHDANGKAVEDVTYYYLIVGANVKGNIYGGGNNAEVTGSTSVVIGKKKTE